MDIITTASVSGKSSTTFHAQQPLSTQQQAALPPGIGIRLPQAGIMALAASGMPAVPDSAPQLRRRPAPDSPRSRLCAAARDGDVMAVKLMLAAGNGDLNTVDPVTGMSALVLAARRGHDDVVFLLCNGASASDIHRADAHGDSALTLAAAAGHADVVELLLGKAATQQHKDQALVAADVNGQAASIRLLLSHGARIDQPDALGATPHPKAAALSMGESELMHAAEGGDLARTQKLLAAGADVNEADDGGWTPLFIAAHHGHAALVTLQAQGAHIDYLNHNGETALMAAARTGQLATTQVLLDGGADGLRCNPRGKTASQMARDMGHALLAIALDSTVPAADVASMTIATTAGTTTASTSAPCSAEPSALAWAGPLYAPTTTTLLHAIECNDAKALDRQLTVLRRCRKNIGQELNRLGTLEKTTDTWMEKKELTPLMAAAYLGHSQLLARMIQIGADVNQSNSRDETALMLAALQGSTAIVQTLLLSGGSVDFRDCSDWTALMYAAQNGHTATVQALLQAGADYTPRNNEGYTALSIAIQRNHEEIIKLLRAYGAIR